MFARYSYANADLQRRQQLRWLGEEVKEAVLLTASFTDAHRVRYARAVTRSMLLLPAKWLGQPLAVHSL